MGSDCHSSCLAGVKDRFGKTKLETSDSKWGLSKTHVLCGFTLRFHRIMVKRAGRIQHEPLCEELENLVLAFLGQPRLSRDVQIDLLKIHFKDLGRKRCYKVLCKRPIFILQWAGQLGRIAEPG
jgi:hypothetical protein